MRLAHTFIDRPILATVLSVFVTLVGLGALAILRFEQKIVLRIAIQGFLQIHADYFQLAILSAAKNLGIVEFGVRSSAA